MFAFFKIFFYFHIYNVRAAKVDIFNDLQYTSHFLLDFSAYANGCDGLNKAVDQYRSKSDYQSIPFYTSVRFEVICSRLANCLSNQYSDDIADRAEATEPHLHKQGLYRLTLFSKNIFFFRICAVVQTCERNTSFHSNYSEFSL